MQRPLGFEILLLARYLAGRPKSAQAVEAARIFYEVDQAEAHFLRHNRPHPQFGDGSLMARLIPLRPGPEIFADAPRFLDALQIAARALSEHNGTLCHSEERDFLSPGPAREDRSAHGRDQAQSDRR